MWGWSPAYMEGAPCARGRTATTLQACRLEEAGGGLRGCHDGGELVIRDRIGQVGAHRAVGQQMVDDRRAGGGYCHFGRAMAGLVEACWVGWGRSWRS